MFNVEYLGSQAAIMFLASNICWVSSGTVRALTRKTQELRIERAPEDLGMKNQSRDVLEVER